MKIVNKLIPIILILVLAGIGFLIYGWSQNGRYSFRVEKGGALSYLIDSRSGKVEIFLMQVGGGFGYVHKQTIDAKNP
jgi:hypothetical protein